jgi:hypothetical protein
MPTTTRRSSHTCPRCSLALTVVRTGENVTVEYDIAEWGRSCRHQGSGSPLACPEVQSGLRDWLKEE